MTPEIEKVVNSGMDTQKSLRLQGRFEPTHPPLPNSSRLMRQFGAIVGIVRRIMNRPRSQFPMGDTVASQLVRHDLPRLTLMALDQTPEEPLGGLAISTRL